MSLLDEELVSQLVACDDDGSYRVNEESLRWLAAQEGPLGVLTCAGKYRTGKSYLLNRLSGASRMDAFGVGNTVQACTKGIWLRRRVLEGAHCRYVCLDTEGIDALDADNTHDVRIFTLALLLSSLFVYNSVGAIDESSMQTLALMTRVSQCVRVRADEEGESSMEALSAFLPHFVWVLRDFTLQITDREGRPMSNDAYLEAALREVPTEKQTVRRAIATAFARRTLVTLPRPCADEHLTDLTRRARHVAPAFDQRVEALREYVRDEIQPLRADGVALSGAMYATLVSHLVRGIGDARVPVIRDAWTLMSEVRGREVKAAALAEARRALDAGPVPTDGDVLETRLRAVHEAALRQFDEGLLDVQPALRRELEEELRADGVRARATLEAAIERELTHGLEALAARCAVVGGAREALGALRVARDALQAPADAPHGARWRAAVFDRALDEWLPGACARDEHRWDESAARVQGVDERLQSAVAALARAADEREAAVADARRLMEIDLAQLRLDAEHAAAQLDAERERTAALQRRQLELEVAAQRPREVATASVAVMARSVASDECSEDEDADGGSVHAELRAARAALNDAHEERRLVDEELAELREIRSALLVQLEGLERAEAEQADRWTHELLELRQQNEAAVASARARADRQVAEAQRERSVALDEARRLVAEAAVLRGSCAQLDARLEELQASYRRELARAAETDERTRSSHVVLQEKLMGMHRQVLDESRARDERQRTEQEQQMREVLELHARCAAAQLDLEQARGEGAALKRRLDEAHDAQRELKRAKVAETEAQTNMVRVQTELREVRRWREEAVREREELRRKLHETERALAVATKELQLERARLVRDHL